MRNSPSPEKFLIVDDNAESRMLLTRTLLRKHPEAVIQECQNGDTAVAVLRAERIAAVIAHRTFEQDSETLIRLLRRAAPAVPIVMVSGHDKQAVASSAGADAFMHFDGWLTIGTVVAEAIEAREKANQASGNASPESAAPQRALVRSVVVA